MKTSQNVNSIFVGIVNVMLVSWKSCNTLCTSGFVDNAISSNNRPYGAGDGIYGNQV